MLKLFAVTVFVLSVATSAQGMTPAPFGHADGMMTQVAVGCGMGRTRINGVCVARTTVRHARRAARRCLRWHGGGGAANRGSHNWGFFPGSEAHPSFGGSW